MLEDTKLIQALENFWNPTNEYVLVYNAHLNKIQYEEFSTFAYIPLWFKTSDGPSSLVYKYPPLSDHVIIRIYSSDLIYGAAPRFNGTSLNQILYFLGDVITRSSPDEVALAQHVQDSEFLLRKHSAYS